MSLNPQHSRLNSDTATYYSWSTCLLRQQALCSVVRLCSNRAVELVAGYKKAEGEGVNTGDFCKRRSSHVLSKVHTYCISLRRASLQFSIQGTKWTYMAMNMSDIAVLNKFTQGFITWRGLHDNLQWHLTISGDILERPMRNESVNDIQFVLRTVSTDAARQ